MWLINCAFVGQRNFDIIEMHGTTIKKVPYSYLSRETLSSKISLVPQSEYALVPSNKPDILLYY
jgi:hypothetical protein